MADRKTDNIKYKPLNLPESLVEELKVWRMAYTTSYGRQVTYAEMLRGMLSAIDKHDAGVCEAMDRLVEEHPELVEKMGNYKGLHGAI